MSRALSVLLLLGVVACSHSTIPNTDVEDTPDSRDVVNFVERYRQAVVSRNVSQLLGLVANDYYDDMGTPQGDDDVDREVLKERLEQTFGPELLAVHYDIRYRDVVFLPTKVLVDYTYIGRFRVSTPDGSRWERRLADNRIVLGKKKDGTYTIMSGM